MAICYYRTRSGEWKIDPWAEVVNGIVVGRFTWPYEFWTRDGKTRIAGCSFENDEQAVTWFRENYPAQFAAGVEMRVFDQN